MIIMVALVLSFMMSMSDSIIQFNSEAIVKEVVDENADELDYDDRKIDYDDIEFYEDGVVTLIYSEEGELLLGNISNIENFDVKLEDSTLKREYINGLDYYIYDKLVEFKHHSPIYIRGILPISAVSNTMREIFLSVIFALPVFIILAGFGSYLISKNSFAPIDTIIKTANDISHSDDLSLRINLLKKNNEIHNLAETFDEMFTRLEETFQTEKQFSSDVSHELRTPVAVIMAECEFVLNNEVELEDTKEAIEVINRQSLKMQSIITNLLNLTRFENGINKASFENINLSELVLIVCEEQQNLAIKDISLTYEIKDDVFGKFDHAMILRLVSNLIDNAFNYGNDNGFIHVSLAEEMIYGKEFITLVVKDDGIGIKKSEQQKIWNRFYQVEKARTAKEGSNMGLGLSMVMQIVKLHRGNIYLESDIGEGSCFTVKFPKF